MKQLSIFLAWLLGALGLGFICTEFFDPYPQTIIALMGINVVLAVSLNLVNGFTGQFSLGHAGFMAVGAYVSALFTTVLFPQWLGSELLSQTGIQEVVLCISILLGGALSGIVGILVGIPSLRLRGDYLAVVNLGFGEMIRIFILNIEAVGGARGFYGIPQIVNLYWIIIFAFLSILFIHRVLKSVIGKQFMAVRDDETATLAMGLSTTQIKVRSFVISSFFAGVAGALFAHFYAYLNPATFTFNYSFQVVAMVVLGGMGSLTGSIVAAVLLTGLLEVLRGAQDYTGMDLRMVIYSLILIVIMLTRPQGIFGSRELWDFFKKKKASV